MTLEEAILRSYSVYISNFSHDEAWEVIEREKEVRLAGAVSAPAGLRKSNTNYKIWD